MKPTQYGDFLAAWRMRFAQHPRRHPAVDTADVEARLRRQPDRLQVLFEMANAGGEPDVIGPPDATGAVFFCDCATETPTGRRSLCYDEEARAARKENRPAGSAVALAALRTARHLGSGRQPRHRGDEPGARHSTRRPEKRFQRDGAVTA